VLYGVLCGVDHRLRSCPASSHANLSRHVQSLVLDGSKCATSTQGEPARIQRRPAWLSIIPAAGLFFQVPRSY
jgi:hypothetical protein